MNKKVLLVIGVIIVVVALVVGLSRTHMSKGSTASTTAASSNSVLTVKTSSTLGKYYAGATGGALYVFGGDTTGVSNCTGSCLAAWPAYVDTGSTTNLPTGVGTIKRSDTGQNQYTYNGKPLYYFASDSNGQVTGNGVMNFSLAKPAATASATTAAPAASSTSNNNNQSSNGY